MNIKKIFLLCLFSIFCLIPVVGAADKDITVKSVSAVDASKEVSLNSIDDVDVEFNDLGQYAEYEVELKNNSDKDLYLNSLTVTNSSEAFIKYSLDDEDIGTEIDANSTKKVKFLIKTTSIDKAGKNVDDSIKFKLSFGETIKVINPETNNNVVEIILSIILIGIVLFIIFGKTNKKIKLSVLIISLVIFGTTSVLADDEITVKFDGNVSYNSQVLMENTGTTLVSNQVNYENSKDVWSYYDQVKNIYIKSLSKAPSKYAYKFDLTTSDKNKVVGYLVENGDTNVPFDLYIVGNGVIYANEDSTALFSENNSALEYSYFAAQKRLDEQNVPQLSCKNNNDKFTVSSDTGNGALTYPIGLLTADEMVISGVVEYNNYSSNTNSYLYNIGDMWSMTPHLYNRAENVFLYHEYSLGTRNVNNTYSVVPAISLKSGVDYLSGNGYMQQPYVINTN